MQKEKAFLELTAAAEELLRAMDKEKLSSSSITKHTVAMAKNALAKSVAYVRMLPVDKQDIKKPVTRRRSNNYNYLAQ